MINLEEQKEISWYDSFISILFYGNWFPLAALISLILFIPYVFIGLIWGICLQLGILGSDGWEGWQGLYIWVPLGAILYPFVWLLALCLSPFCLIVGLFEPCLVIPKDFPQERWLVAVSYLVTPIIIISMVLVTELLNISKIGLTT